MTDYRTLSELTGVSQPLLRQMVSSGKLHLDDTDTPQGSRRNLTVSDAIRACVMVALARVGISYAEGGKLTAPLGWVGGRFVYRSTTCADADAVLAIWAEETSPEGSDRAHNQPRAHYHCALLPASSAANLLARPTIDALVTVPLWRHFDHLSAVAEARRAKARTAIENGWESVLNKAQRS